MSAQLFDPTVVWKKNFDDAESLWQSGFHGVAEQDSRPETRIHVRHNT